MQVLVIGKIGAVLFGAVVRFFLIMICMKDFVYFFFIGDFFGDDGLFIFAMLFHDLCFCQLALCWGFFPDVWFADAFLQDFQNLI